MVGSAVSVEGPVGPLGDCGVAVVAGEGESEPFRAAG
jgi:hypothetical protein